MKTNPTPLTKLTAFGLVACAAAIWTQALSGDPAYPKIPPGAIIFVLIALVITLGARWWWTPMFGALVSLLTTAGRFERLPAEMLRLSHPAAVGGFAVGIFLDTLLQIAAQIVTDIAGIAATRQNYLGRQQGKDGP